MDISAKVAKSLARRSSRRHFIKLLGAGSLGVGLTLTRTETTLGSITGCAGCGGGPCVPSCFSPHQRCLEMPCRPCQLGAGCPVGCTTSGEWFCCVSSCRFRCSECSCPSPQGCCHCFMNLPIPCVPRRHSGDQPCDCPPPPPIPSLAIDG
jgi:hypothetical protein